MDGYKTRIELRGTGWTGRQTVQILIDGPSIAMNRVLQGLPGAKAQVSAERQDHRSGDGVRPDGTGTFVCRVSTSRLAAGEHHVTAVSWPDGHEARVETTVVVRERNNGGHAPQAAVEGGEASADDAGRKATVPSSVNGSTGNVVSATSDASRPVSGKRRSRRYSLPRPHSSPLGPVTYAPAADSAQPYDRFRAVPTDRNSHTPSADTVGAQPWHHQS